MSSIDPLKFKIEVQDPDAIPNAMNAAADATDEATSAMSAGFQRLVEIIRSPIQYIHELKAELSSVADENPRIQELMDTLEAQKAEAGVQKLQKQLSVTKEEARELFDTMESGSGEAESAFSKLGDTITKRLIVSEIIMNLRQLPTVIEDIIGALSGWDKAAQKTYEDLIKDNDKYVKVLDEARDAQIRLANEGNPITATKEIIEAKRQELATYQRTVAARQEEINSLTGFADGAGIAATAVHALNSAGINLATGGHITELTKQMDDAQKKATELALEIQKLSTVEVPKEQLNQDKKDTKKGEAAAKKEAELLARLNDVWAKGLEERANIQKAVNKKMEEEENRFNDEWARGIQQREVIQKQVDKQVLESAIRTEEEMLRIDKKGNDEIDRMITQNTREALKASADIIKIAKKEAAEREKIDRQLTNVLDKDLFSHFDKALTGQESFAKAFKQTWAGIETSVLQVFEKMASAWLAQYIEQKLEAAGIIHIQAHVAAAKAFASAPNPIVGAVEASAAEAEVDALSFDRGGVMPSDGLALLHKNEMTLNPSLSAGIQNIISSGNANPKGGGTTSITNNLHYNASGTGGTGGRSDANKMMQLIARRSRYSPSTARSI